MPAGQGAHPQIGSSSYIQVLLSSLPSGHFLTHTLSPRSISLVAHLQLGVNHSGRQAGAESPLWSGALSALKPRA